MRYTISYVSTGTPSLSSEDIQQLMEFVKIQNNLVDITGILMYAEGNFFQVLEGEKEVVLSLFEKIKKDPKHYNIIQIIHNETSTPTFSIYHSSFTVIKDGTGMHEFQNFLKYEKRNNPDNFKSISYMAAKFMNL